MTAVRLSIVILNYKTKHLLRLVIKNLMGLHLTIPYEIIVVDNASHDGSVEMVRELYPSVQVVASSANTGHARGNNIGITQARGEYVVVMNTDIIFFTPQDIVDIVSYLDHHPAVAMLGPKLRNADGTIQYSCFRPYSRFTPLYRRTPVGRLAWAKQDLAEHLMTDFKHDTIREVDWLLGAVLFIRRSVLQQVGAFNESFFLYFADFELCDRVRWYQYKVIYYPFVNIVHYHRRESAQGSIWGGLGSLLNYTTRVHLSDWRKYRRIVRQGYASYTTPQNL